MNVVRLRMFALLACGALVSCQQSASTTDNGRADLEARLKSTQAQVAALSERIEAATAAGIARNKIILDPGFGFGKRLDENYPLLARIDQLHQLNLPILVGASRKGFLANALAPLYEGTPPPVEDRLSATTAANVAAILGGAHIIRTHDVRPATEASAIADRILAAV